ESGVTQTADPLGGSHYVEYLTNTIELAARGLLSEIEKRGGAARAIESGFFQRAISRAAYAEQRALEAKDKVVVGVNQFEADEPQSSMPSPDYAVLAGQQRDRVRSTRAGRDETGCRAAIEALNDGASGNVCLMPLIVDAVRARATVGEISDVLRESWGVYHPA
ncbi:MAG: methylmalonyl-CoA mutase family protein, partial [Gemmatimonadales bacterium]